MFIPPPPYILYIFIIYSCAGNVKRVPGKETKHFSLAIAEEMKYNRNNRLRKSISTEVSP
jgi:hypothetical protein